MLGTLKLLVGLALLHVACAHSAEEWKSRTIYQLLTDRFGGVTGSCHNLQNYCGGTFQGIIQHLDYIIGMGFDAIWISPVVTNSAGGYHGYWASDFYTINSHFGTASDLKALVAACHAKGVWVMVDIVANHVAPVGMDFKQITPFSTAADYHPNCAVTQYTCFTQETLTCRLDGLPDLDQSNPFVRQALLGWIQSLVGNYSFDGVRADTVMYINQDFWRDFQQKAGVYIVGEVESSVDCCAAYQKNGVDATLSYPMYWTLFGVFAQGQTMNNIQGQVQAYNAFPKQQYLGTFIDNHDNPRFLSTGKLTQYYNALTYVLLGQGIPIIYYGTEQNFNGGNDPYCREPLWPTNYNTNTNTYNFLKSVIAFRKQSKVWDYPQVQRYSTNNFYAFTRGNVFVALTNVGAGNSVTYPITYHPYSDGTKLCNVLSPNDCLTVHNRQFAVTLQNGMPKIYVPS